MGDKRPLVTNHFLFISCLMNSVPVLSSQTENTGPGSTGDSNNSPLEHTPGKAEESPSPGVNRYPLRNRSITHVDTADSSIPDQSTSQPAKPEIDHTITISSESDSSYEPAEAKIADSKSPEDTPSSRTKGKQMRKKRSNTEPIARSSLKAATTSKQVQRSKSSRLTQSPEKDMNDTDRSLIRELARDKARQSGKTVLPAPKLLKRVKSPKRNQEDNEVGSSSSTGRSSRPHAIQPDDIEIFDVSKGRIKWREADSRMHATKIANLLYHFLSELHDELYSTGTVNYEKVGLLCEKLNSIPANIQRYTQESKQLARKLHEQPSSMEPPTSPLTGGTLSRHGSTSLYAAEMEVGSFKMNLLTPKAKLPAQKDQSQEHQEREPPSCPPFETYISLPETNSFAGLFQNAAADNDEGSR